jgi:hypothetical protein
VAGVVAVAVIVHVAYPMPDSGVDGVSHTLRTPGQRTASSLAGGRSLGLGEMSWNRTMGRREAETSAMTRRAGLSGQVRNGGQAQAHARYRRRSRVRGWGLS